MGRLESVLKEKDILALDTNSLIYLLEKNVDYFNICKEIFSSIEKGTNHGVTSVLILTEVLTKPYKDNNQKLVSLYRTFINAFPNMTIKEMDHKIAIKAAKLRALYKLKTPDSIFIATAINEKAQAFVTNDIRLNKVKELDFIILDDYI